MPLGRRSMRSIILLVVVLMSVAAVSNRVCHLATRASVGVATDVRQIFVPRWASLVYLFVPVHISKPGLIFAQTFGVAGDGKLFSTIVLKYWQTVRPRKQSKVDKARSVATRMVRLLPLLQIDRDLCTTNQNPLAAPHVSDVRGHGSTLNIFAC